jgi:hypothetical protein
VNIKFFNEYIFAFLIRALLFVFLLIFPISHNEYGLLSPLSYYGNIADIELYKSFYSLINLNFEEFIEYYFFSFNLLKENEYLSDFIYPKILIGPLFPIILKITYYSELNTLYLALLCILIEFLSICIWIKYFKNYKIPRILIYLFCILPIPQLFSYAHTSDIFFYFFSTIFFYLTSLKTNNNYKILLVLFILLLIRPTSIIYVLFVFFLLFSKRLYINKIQIFLLVIIIFLNIFYYFPYVNYEIYKNFIFFETSNPDLFINFSNNHFINNIIFYLYKFLSTIGFQMSNSKNIIMIIPKYFSATIFLIGFIYMNFKNLKDSEVIFINFYLLFIILFLSPQYRYILPLSPLLFMYFCLSLRNFSIYKQE